MRFAVVGCGKMGRLHASKLAAMRDVELVAVCDTMPFAAGTLADQLGCDWVVNHADLNPDGAGLVDAAVVATPAKTHAAIARDLLESGIHVLVEKPIALETDDAEQLTELAEAAGLVLQVGHLERFNQTFDQIAAKSSLAIYAQRHCLPNGKADVDVALDLMIHDIDLILSLTGDAPIRVAASGNQDTAVAELHFPDGSTPRLFADRKAAARETMWTVDGESFKLLGEHDCLHDQLRHFIDCIRTGSSPKVGGREATAALRVALEISRQIGAA